MPLPIAPHPACQCCSGLSRRRLVGTGLAATAALWAVRPRRSRAQSTLSPDAALAQLAAGNQRFIGQKLQSLDEDLAVLKQNTAEKQEPFAAVLSCADSRVPVELVFDQSIGRLFVARVAGNVATNDIIASLEYGAAVLGTKVILVLGHSNCGAVKAAIAGKPAPGQISGLYPYLRAAVTQAGPDPDATGQANARIQAQLLATASPVLADLIAGNALKVAAGFYDIATGKVAMLS
ncbi:MAG: carbonic anhydrase [Acetobacteraceae bacterium]